MSWIVDERFSTLCGYTQHDFTKYFPEQLKKVDLNKLKEWYNGYNFLGESVYNPYDILLFLDRNKTYHNYWFETGTSSFLIKLFQKNDYFLPDLDNIEVGEELLSSFEISTLEPITLLFQSGDLTIKESYIKRTKTVYSLGKRTPDEVYEMYS